MDLIVIDDSVQSKPWRSGMGRLVAVGGAHIPRNAVRRLERAIDKACDDAGFPAGEEFKWSPHRKTWMHKELRGDARTEFFTKVLRLAKKAGATGLVVSEDSSKRTAIESSSSPEEDVVKLLLERAHTHLSTIGAEALLLADHPGGGRSAQDRFLGDCIETLKKGTDYVVPKRVTLPVTADSKSIRLLQLVDLIVGSSLSFVAGHSDYAAKLFSEHVKPLLCRDSGRYGGIGLKIHPAGRYANLYHWLLGDSRLGPGRPGRKLPVRGRPYAESPDRP